MFCSAGISLLFSQIWPSRYRCRPGATEQPRYLQTDTGYLRFIGAPPGAYFAQPPAAKAATAEDAAQIMELMTLGELQRRAMAQGVQAMIEGPGHVPIQDIKANVDLQKRLCNGAPFYVLGPLTTDIAPGYDHITSAIGGAMAASFGADFLCYVTPAEHLMLPTIDDVFQGVIAARIAAHSGDIGKGIKRSIERDRLMSKYRRELNWEGMYSVAIDPELATKRRAQSESSKDDVCTMCGDLCAIKNFNEAITREN